jgi:hypothetical protein
MSGEPYYARGGTLLLLALEIRCNQLGAKSREEADRIMLERGLATMNEEGVLTVHSMVVDGVQVAAPEVVRFIEEGNS